MRNYLSFGGGVNSVALYLLLLEQGVDFEAVYVDHGCDWPETRAYAEMFMQTYPVTVITPNVEGFTNLYEYFMAKGKIAMRFPRWCTKDWKTNQLEKYYEKPAWVYIGYAFDEAHRATISTSPGYEYRWPLIEQEITRRGCIEIIKQHGLPVPMKSGCWFCPFQSVKDYKTLKRIHPDLFCKAVEVEKNHRKVAWERHMRCDAATILHKPLDEIVDEKGQQSLFPEMAMRPCECGL